MLPSINVLAACSRTLVKKREVQCVFNYSTVEPLPSGLRTRRLFTTDVRLTEEQKFRERKEQTRWVKAMIREV